MPSFDQIHVDTGALDQYSGAVQTEVDRVRTCINNMQAAIQNAMAHWESDSATRFRDLGTRTCAYLEEADKALQVTSVDKILDLKTAHLTAEDTGSSDFGDLSTKLPL
jgi:uncharacterized protein YukE